MVAMRASFRLLEVFWSLILATTLQEVSAKKIALSCRTSTQAAALGLSAGSQRFLLVELLVRARHMRRGYAASSMARQSALVARGARGAQGARGVRGARGAQGAQIHEPPRRA